MVSPEPSGRSGAAPEGGASSGAVITWAGFGRGARMIAPLLVPVFVLGVAFGLIARNAGLETWAATFMSGLVFAGSSQFAVLELWTAPVPWVPILLATFAVNSRYLLLGAALYPWTRALPRWKVYASMVLMTDQNWATAIEAHARGERDFGHMLGGGAVLWVVWTASSAIGAAGGGLTLDDIHRFGLDLVMVAFFACMLVGLHRGRTDDLPWLVAAAAAMLAVWLLPPNWHVMAGGIAGGVAGLLQHEAKRGRGREPGQ